MDALLPGEEERYPQRLGPLEMVLDGIGGAWYRRCKGLQGRRRQSVPLVNMRVEPHTVGEYVDE